MTAKEARSLSTSVPDTSLEGIIAQITCHAGIGMTETHIYQPAENIIQSLQDYGYTLSPGQYSGSIRVSW